MFVTTQWDRIQAAQRADRAALDELVTRYRPALVRYIDRWYVAGAEAEDLAQEVFLELLSSGALRRVDPERGRFRGWLLGVTKHVVRNAQRRAEAAKRGGDRPRQPLPLDVPAPEPEDVEFDRIWYEHLLDQALRSLARRNPRQREALRLRFEQGRSYEEIVASMGRSLQQVKNDLHRGREQVKAEVLAAIRAYAPRQDEYLAELVALRDFVGLWR